jgi:thymidylate kinase
VGRCRPSRIALVGADGAGKSTISTMLETAELPFPVKRIYMGVNLEASTDMLPTTRLLFAAKRLRTRLRGRPPLPSLGDTTHRPGVRQEPAGRGPGTGSLPGWRRAAKDLGRLSTWMTEEWLRLLLAESYTRRGYVVVFDRHFFVDYHGAESLVRSAAPRSAIARAHSWMLEHLYPRPDVVICLDAPAEVLRDRKAEDSLEWLEARRQQYLRLADDVPVFAVVDVDRPVEQVYADVLRAIDDHRVTPRCS